MKSRADNSDNFEAHQELGKLRDAFEQAADDRNKKYAGYYEQLLDAETLIFGSVNDPLALHTKICPIEGKKLLEKLSQTFDDIASQSEQRAQQAFFYKQKHAARAERFTKYSETVRKVISHLK